MEIKEQIRNIAYKVFDCGWEEQPNYKLFPEQQPWVILLYNMCKEDPKELLRLSKYVEEAIKDVKEPDFQVGEKNIWQVFNSSMQFSIGEAYVWFWALKGTKK